MDKKSLLLPNIWPRPPELFFLTTLLKLNVWSFSHIKNQFSDSGPKLGVLQFNFYHDTNYSVSVRLHRLKGTERWRLSPSQEEGSREKMTVLAP